MGRKKLQCRTIQSCTGLISIRPSDEKIIRTVQYVFFLLLICTPPLPSTRIMTCNHTVCIFSVRRSQLCLRLSEKCWKSYHSMSASDSTRTLPFAKGKEGK